jgi:hypothetical protein
LQFVKQVQGFLQECVGPDEALGADDLVPATIYCLVAGCADVLARERPLLVVRLIYEMAPMTGEEEYGVANFEGALTHLATPQESRESMRSKAGIDADASMGEEGESKAAGGRGDVRMDGVPAFDDSWLAVPAKQVEPPPPPPSIHAHTATPPPDDPKEKERGGKTPMRRLSSRLESEGDAAELSI